MAVKRGRTESGKNGGRRQEAERRHKGRVQGGRKKDVRGERAQRRRGIREELREQIRQEVSGNRDINDEELYELIDRLIMEKGEREYLPLKERIELRAALFNSFRKLDILQQLIDDPDITELMINGPGHVFVERRGRMELWDQEFDSLEQLEDMIQQMVSQVNRTVNVASPIADARLPDGSRVHVVLPPISLDGPVVTIRKFPRQITMNMLIESGTVSFEAAEFLKKLVRAGYNIFISGGTNSGKTTFLNALSAYIPQDERVITIEDSAELQIQQVKRDALALEKGKGILLFPNPGGYCWWTTMKSTWKSRRRCFRMRDSL